MDDTSALNVGTEESPEYVIGAVDLVRNFDSVNSYIAVTSMLCYGVQWDVVMKWMEDEKIHLWKEKHIFKTVQEWDGMEMMIV